VVVNEGEQERLAARDHRTVQGITGPPIVRGDGLEPAERPRRQPIRAGVELQTGEVPLQRAGRRHRTSRSGVGSQDRADLRGRARGHFPLQRGRQLQHRRGRGRVAVAHRGQQRVEPAAAPGQDPAVERDPGDLEAFTGRAGVLPFRELPDQPAPLPGRQRRVGGLPDQGVAEQPDLPGPVSPTLSAASPVVLMSCPADHRASTSSAITPWLVVICQGRRLSAPDVAAQGQLVLAARPGPSSRPPLAAEANCQAGRGPNSRAAAAAANPSACRASANTELVTPTASAEASRA